MIKVTQSSSRWKHDSDARAARGYRGGACPRAGRLSIPPDHDGDRVPAGRRGRHHRAPHRVDYGKDAEAPCHYRKQARRGGRHGQRLCRQREAGRLYRPDGALIGFGDSGSGTSPRTQASLRAGAIRADRADIGRSGGPRRPRRGALEKCLRIHLGRAAEAGQDHLQLVRNLRRAAHAFHSPRARHGDNLVARALQRRRSGYPGLARLAGGRHRGRAGDHDRPDQGQAPAPAGELRKQAARRASRCADAQGARHRCRVLHLGRLARAESDAARNPANAAKRGTADGRGSGVPGGHGQGRDSHQLSRRAGVPEILGRRREKARRSGEAHRTGRAKKIVKPRAQRVGFTSARSSGRRSAAYRAGRPSVRVRGIEMAAAQGKVIVTCAVTGSIHTPSMSPHLPVTPEEIAEGAIGAAAAGAAIVHLHARNPVDGRPDQSPEAFEPFLRVIKQSSNVVVNLTTGGSPYMTVEERVRPAATWKPEVASLNMGSMNFGLFPMLKRYKSFKHDWEPQMLEGSHDLVFRNSFKDIRYALETLNSSGARYEFECYDTSHLYNLHYFWTERLVKAPLFIQTVFGLLGGIGSHQEDVMHMKRTADRLFGDNYRWSVLGAGRAQMPVAAIAAAIGGNVRVGLEDSLWIGAGRLAETNAAQVTQVRKIIEGLGLEIASPDEAREILQLKGGDKVAF